jgi:acid-sensing ion channel, other
VYIHNLSLNAVESTDNPIRLTPGLNTELKIKRIFKETLPYPYSNCIKDVSSSYNSLLVKNILTKTNSLYRQKDCFNLCQSRYMINKCNLNVSLGFTWEVNWGIDNKFPCANNANIEFLKKNLNDLCLNDCPTECDSIEFSIDVMTSKFPSQAYALQLMNNSKIISNYPSGYNITLDDLRESMVQFNVYYTDFEYTKISQIPKQQFTDIVSNLGGLLGLFIGMSFLSFGEFIEVIVEVLLIFCEKKNQVKQSTIS